VPTPAVDNKSDLMGVGEWLLDERLLNRRLDICVRGTAPTLFHNGRYENQAGFLVLTERPSSVNQSILVKIGYHQSKLLFPLRYLAPEYTTEIILPKMMQPSTARPVVSTLGARVVIIGADLAGNHNFVGHYGFIVDCPYHLDPGQACVHIVDCISHFGYFDEKVLCRSVAEPVEWEDSVIY
jgi:hypothetical protein